MDKAFLVYVAIGVGFLYFIVNFVGDIQSEDEKYRNDGYNQEHMYDKYKGQDSIGRDVLNLIGENESIQVAAWNESTLKEEYLELFPDFEEMSKFVKERVNGKILQSKLLAQISSAEDKFFSGTISAEEAKQELSTLK
ncbi:hypothetical protein MNB_SV-5-119 [hydrothermal vent metagenome]|uniref:Uncharacterized protein n=1 Tax=hydrothermal vent metagenome TaxID=652676 RepID=A0A1W1EFT3_9ZZZZ